MSVFYDRLLNLCAERGVSLSRAAKDIGLSNAAASGWADGSIPRDTTIVKLANYFNVSPGYMKGEEQKENPTATMDSEALKDNGYYELNEDNKKLIDQMIAQLIKSQSGD